MNKTGDSEERREACGGGRQLPVPERRQASRFNSHPQMRLTPDNPESTHCQERFCNSPAIYAGGAQGPRRPPEQQPGKSHRTPHQPKRPRMPDSAPWADMASSGPHTPQLRPVPSRRTNGLRPPVVPGTASRHPGRRSDSRRPPTPHERTLHAGTGRAHTVILPACMLVPETGHSAYVSRAPATPAIRPLPVHMAWDLEA